MVEQILEDFDRAYGLKSVCLRYFNAAGADPDGQLGERHEPETHLIPLILQAASGRREAVTVFGRDYDTPDGTCIRDYVHVADLASAHALAVDYLLAGGERTAFNLGNGLGFSVQQVIDTARAVTGRHINALDAPRRARRPATAGGGCKQGAAGAGLAAGVCFAGADCAACVAVGVAVSLEPASGLRSLGAALQPQNFEL